ncbi:HAT C-terminal dimerization domain [Arabidopsis suecica]|uniref:HAT C-terminal dimerization domain n=1 Tax=Arabidopsis suecica TaxID=45249 RepID=A0A8T2BDQ2_ARASU|nr:HAT C-terminal dimerization domain [Arabidopsis suecica]
MDLESLQTIAFLNAQNDLIDMNEEDAEVQAPEQSETQIQPTQTQQAPRKRRKTSNVWDDFISDLFELERSIEAGVNNTKSHLDIYLAEPRLEWKAFPNLDVLRYWKDNQHRLGDLALMAIDILSIPITTVSSESAFSIGSRVLTPYRNRLLPQNVRPLLCTRNWLRGFAEYEGTVEDNDDTTL